MLLASCCPLGTVFLEELGTVALFIPGIFTHEVRSVQSQSHLPAAPLLAGRRAILPSPGRGMRVPHAHVCGVEVLPGYCCEEPGELRSHGASPALPSWQKHRHSLAPSPGGAGIPYLTGILCRICPCCPRVIQTPKPQTHGQRALPAPALSLPLVGKLHPPAGQQRGAREYFLFPHPSPRPVS